MSKSSATESAVALAWSLWSDLGVPGVQRNHDHVEIDPEPLIVVTPLLAASDARLMEQALSWCVGHADRVATSRITGLLGVLPDEVASAFSGFAATVNAVGRANWPAGAAEPWPQIPKLRDIPLPMARPSLLRLRARALCGLGARADALCDLLASPDTWVTADDLSDNGHTKRNMARVLAELTEAGLIQGRRDGNVRLFRCANPPLAQSLGGLPVDMPRWTPIFKLVVLSTRLDRMQDLPPAVRRVAANTLRDQLAELADGLSLDRPPETRGVPEAWERTRDWARTQLEQIADGSSPAITGPMVTRRA